MHSSLNMSNKDFLLDTMNSNTFNFSFLLRLFMKMVQSSPYSVLQPWQVVCHHSSDMYVLSLTNLLTFAGFTTPSDYFARFDR